MQQLINKCELYIKANALEKKLRQKIKAIYKEKVPRRFITVIYQ
jgi:hypothetical protein